MPDRPLHRPPHRPSGRLVDRMSGRLTGGLRFRVTALFAAMALGVSVALAASTYSLTRTTLVAERERTAVRSAYLDAQALRAGLSAPQPAVVDVLRALETGPTRRPLLRLGGEWYARTADAGLTEAVPASLQRLAEEEQPGLQRVENGGAPLLVVAVPLPDNEATYYAVTDLSELQGTLNSVALILALVALGTTVAGAALGYYGARRVTKPLESVTEAATSIAAGDLDRRLDPAREPDLARLTASFNAMVDELSARIERDRRFAADVSHELRSPLQTLSAVAEVLERRQGALDPRSGAAVGLLTTELARFQDLVTDLLELAKSDQRLERAPVDLVALAQDACRGRGVAPAADGPVVVPGDARRLRQVVVNLLDNAERHGGGAVALTVQALGDRVRLDVDDAGPGVPEEERTLVFDRFARGRSAGARRDSEGTGLGLALVAQHVAAHHGTVEVLDRPGGGARFRVELPC